MHTRCPRCQLEFDAVSAWIQCPRCSTPFAAPTLAPVAGSPVIGTQAMDPDALAQVMRASTPHASPPSAPPRAPTPQPAGASPGSFRAGPSGAPQPQFAPAPQAGGRMYRDPGLAPSGFVADEDLAGRAVVSVVMSVVALVGGCNPIGLVGVTMGLMAYSAANDRRVDLARARGRRARRVAWASLAITVVVCGLAALSLFYTLAL